MHLSSGAELERRKQLRLRLRPDLIIQPQKHRGQTCYVVKDPVNLRYYRFQVREHFLMRLMDGRRTLADAHREFEQNFRPARLTLEEIEGFAQLLLSASLVQSESVQSGEYLLGLRRRQARRRIVQRLTEFLYIQIPLFDPDRLLSRLFSVLSPAFTRAAVALGVGIILAAALFVGIHFDAFRERLPELQGFFSWQQAVSLWCALVGIKAIHELAHGLTCKAFGGETHEMGLMILCFTPCMYCNVSDAWMIPSKWRRIAVSMAGVYVELLIASLATYVWWHSPSSPWLNHVALSLMVVCGISTVIFNANPLLRFDGYYALADWLEIPNLRERSDRFLRQRALATCLGVDVTPEPAPGVRRGSLFVTYAIASYLYRWLVMIGVIWLLYRFLKPYHLGAVGAMLAAAALISMVGRPILRVFNSWSRWKKLPTMKPTRIAASGVLLAAAAVAFFECPLPWSPVRGVGLVQWQPDGLERIYLPASAALQRVYVHDGQEVRRGAPLADFRSLDLENRLEEARCEYEIRASEARTLGDEANNQGNSQQRADLDAARVTTAGAADSLARSIQLYEQMLRGLSLTAPRAGIVVSVPRVEEMGRFWSKEEDRAVCAIGDLKALRAVAAVSPQDYRLLQDELHGGRQIRVGIRIAGSSRGWYQGRITSLPESEAREIPFALTVPAGGSVPVQPGTLNHPLPASACYVVSVDLDEPVQGITPGSRAQVAVRLPGRSCAWWLKRAFSSAFDFGP